MSVAATKRLLDDVKSVSKYDVAEHAVALLVLAAAVAQLADAVEEQDARLARIEAYVGDRPELRGEEG